jgi:hypothetical protein
MAPLRLTTGDGWDDDAMRPTGGPDPADVEVSLRRSRAYIARFVERIPPLRAIRMKCGGCMGGDTDRMPRGEAAQAIDDCSSVGCPLWPFRFGDDPWRPAPSEAKLAAARANFAKSPGAAETVGTTSPQKGADAAGGMTGQPTLCGPLAQPSVDGIAAPRRGAPGDARRP